MNLTFINNNIFIVEEAFPNKTEKPTLKKLLIILGESEAKEVNRITFLNKVLAAIHCDPQKDTWQYTFESTKHISISELLQTLNTQIVIIFGLEPSSMGIYAQMKKYVFTSIANTSYLLCDSLEEIEKHTPLKAALWEALKKQLT